MRIRAWFDGFSSNHSRASHGNGCWGKRDVASSLFDVRIHEASMSNQAGIPPFSPQNGTGRSAAYLNYRPLSSVSGTLRFRPLAERRGAEKCRRRCADVCGTPCPTLQRAFGVTASPISIEALSATLPGNATRILLPRVVAHIPPWQRGTVSR